MCMGSGELLVFVTALAGGGVRLLVVLNTLFLPQIFLGDVCRSLALGADVGHSLPSFVRQRAGYCLFRRRFCDGDSICYFTGCFL